MRGPDLCDFEYGRVTPPRGSPAVRWSRLRQLPAGQHRSIGHCSPPRTARRDDVAKLVAQHCAAVS